MSTSTQVGHNPTLVHDAIYVTVHLNGTEREPLNHNFKIIIFSYAGLGDAYLYSILGNI
jgi:hypothetical protein